MSDDPSLIDTAQFLPVLPSSRITPQIESSLVEVDLAGLSDQGKVRSNNEDTFFIARFDRTMRALQTSLSAGEYPTTSAETSYGMLVADGVGGHSAGEVASRTAARVLLDLVLQTPHWIMRFNDHFIQEVFRRTEERIHQIQTSLNDQAKADPGLAGMGTTLTLACSLGGDLLIANVGDSRAYLLRNGQLQQLTRDQTLAQQMVEAGMLTAEEAGRHRLKHVLTGVIAAGEVDAPIEFRRFRLADGDQVLLCSDGLTDMISEAALAEALLQPGPASATCHRLIDMALQAGGKDNVTVVLARYRFPELASRE